MHLDYNWRFMKKLLRIITVLICLSSFYAFGMEKPDLDLDENSFEQIVDTFYEKKQTQKLSIETDPKSVMPNTESETVINSMITSNAKRHGRKPQTLFETAPNGELQCSHCPKTAKYRYLLTGHIYKNHGKGLELISCPHCFKNIYKKDLSKHKKTHLNIQ